MSGEAVDTLVISVLFLSCIVFALLYSPYCAVTLHAVRISNRHETSECGISALQFLQATLSICLTFNARSLEPNIREVDQEIRTCKRRLVCPQPGTVRVPYPCSASGRISDARVKQLCRDESWVFKDSFSQDGILGEPG